MITRRITPLLEDADILVYGVVGVVFLAAALCMLAFSLATFPSHVRDQGFPLAISTLLNSILLVVIIMEVLRTVLSYIREQGASLQPFLFIAAISATCRVLALGAEMSVADFSEATFQNMLLDLAVNTLAILVIATAIFLNSRVPQPLRSIRD